MAYVKQLKFKATYKGKTYYRVADFAKATGLDTRLVLARYKRGWRDSKKLALPPINPHKDHSHPAYKIDYQGVQYKSLAEFCRAFRLPYQKADNLWVSGIRDPQGLIIKSQPKKDDIALKEQKDLDYRNKVKVLRKYGLYTSTEVAEITKISRSTILLAAYGLVRKGPKATKPGISRIGLQKDDVVNFADVKSGNELLRISNITALPKTVFKESAIKHIQEQQATAQNLELKRFPFFDENYYYSLISHTMWQKTGKAFKLIKPQNQRTFVLQHNKEKFNFSVKDVEDIYKYSKVKYSNIYSIQDLCRLLKMKQSYWNNHRLGRELPSQHKRYNYSTHQKKAGWTIKEVINAFSKHPEASKFISKLNVHP